MSPRNTYRANDPGELHAEGAKRFGLEWLLTTKAVLRIAGNYRVDKTRNAGFLTDLAFEICAQREKATAAALDTMRADSEMPTQQARWNIVWEWKELSFKEFALVDATGRILGTASEGYRRWQACAVRLDGQSYRIGDYPERSDAKRAVEAATAAHQQNTAPPGETADGK